MPTLEPPKMVAGTRIVFRSPVKLDPRGYEHPEHWGKSGLCDGPGNPQEREVSLVMLVTHRFDWSVQPHKIAVPEALVANAPPPDEPVSKLWQAGMELEKVTQTLAGVTPRSGTIPPEWGGAVFRELADLVRCKEETLSDLARLMGYWPWQPTQIRSANVAHELEEREELAERFLTAAVAALGSPSPAPCVSPKLLANPPVVFLSGRTWTRRRNRTWKNCEQCRADIAEGEYCFGPQSSNVSTRLCNKCVAERQNGTG